MKAKKVVMKSRNQYSPEFKKQALERAEKRSGPHPLDSQHGFLGGSSA